MKCPYCGEQMKSGVIRYDSRSGLRWRSEEEKILIGINSVIPSGASANSQLLKKMAGHEEVSRVNIAPLVRN